ISESAWEEMTCLFAPSLAVLLIIPLAISGAVFAAWITGLTNDVYFQVGMLTTMGLSAKNAILIVEFAQKEYQSGKEVVAATLEGASLRLRPIVMTSLAFVAGVIPLVLSTGAGASSRQEIGITVIGGMFSGTLLTLLFVPLFFIVIRSRAGRKSKAIELFESKGNVNE
ncbi:efflux RND transporter permease subunit, partial [Atlantibacter sp.]|uniref:efflux RND transporter permease subunit n=1 Tax=Atlantibacter sp. TaxID=1903473 RepID=UPI0028A6EA07